MRKQQLSENSVFRRILVKRYQQRAHVNSQIDVCSLKKLAGALLSQDDVIWHTIVLQTKVQILGMALYGNNPVNIYRIFIDLRSLNLSTEFSVNMNHQVKRNPSKPLKTFELRFTKTFH